MTIQIFCVKHAHIHTSVGVVSGPLASFFSAVHLFVIPEMPTGIATLDPRQFSLYCLVQCGVTFTWPFRDKQEVCTLDNNPTVS